MMFAIHRNPLHVAVPFVIATLLGGCQPPLEEEGADPEVLLESFEAAVEAVVEAAAAHDAAVAAAADEGALLAEEAAFASDGHDLFDAAVHAAEELAGCEGMDTHEDDPGPGDVHDMFVDLDAAFEGHHDAMIDADEADRAGIEEAFQAMVELHAGHATDLHDEMHEHAEAGELTCAHDEHDEE